MIKFESERLLFSLLSEGDWPLFESLHKSPSVVAFISDPFTDEQIKTRFNDRLAGWDKSTPQWLCLTISDKSTGLQIGLTGFYCSWEPNKEAELGFMLSPEYQGKGYGYESTVAVLNYAFVECGFEKVTATVTEGNTPSFNLLQKVGLRHIDTIYNNFLLDAEWRDDLILEITQAEFV